VGVDSRAAVGMRIPMGTVWGGYGERNSVPTAALDFAMGMGIPMGTVWGGYGDRNSVPTAALLDRSECRSDTCRAV